MKKTSGITLIALVITIIVLLILAGVSISAVIGENGIATKAKEAAEKTEIAEIKERISVDIIEVQSENGGSITEDELDSVLTEYGTVTEKDGKTIVTTDKNLEVDITDIVSRIDFKQEESESEETGDDNGETKNVISFTIDNVTYTAEEGMTFEEWINSSEFYSADFYVSNSADGWIYNSDASLSAVSGYEEPENGPVECVGTLVIVDGSVFMLEPCEQMSFTIGSESYTATVGITWGDWVNYSAFNTIGLYIDTETNLVMSNDGYPIYTADSSTSIQLDYVIEDGAAYKIGYDEVPDFDGTSNERRC